jgi:hypothetical protein
MDVAEGRTTSRQALVAFDWGASGIWLLNPPEEDSLRRIALARTLLGIRERPRE